MVRIARRENTAPDSSLQTGTEVVVAGCNTDALGRCRVPASCRCIADKCAMWRWVPSTTTHKERRVHEVPGGNPQFYELTQEVPDAPTNGYCGLGGIPLLGA